MGEWQYQPTFEQQYLESIIRVNASFTVIFKRTFNKKVEKFV